ncbi:hypothetical protein TCON_2645 [Astathelohania contejeani]|uniref:Uncharacterized protein n=1 Tax=Astathelohania contejeani TaxID=164912 RepID=A0ABQ7HVF5_9MICR|nr:hypothetical protein TCON_2645 [Thelohania contejeani]
MNALYIQEFYEGCCKSLEETTQPLKIHDKCVYEIIKINSKYENNKLEPLFECLSNYPQLIVYKYKLNGKNMIFNDFIKNSSFSYYSSRQSLKQVLYNNFRKGFVSIITPTALNEIDITLFNWNFESAYEYKDTNTYIFIKLQDSCVNVLYDFSYICFSFAKSEVLNIILTDEIVYSCSAYLIIKDDQELGGESHNSGEKMISYIIVKNSNNKVISYSIECGSLLQIDTSPIPSIFDEEILDGVEFTCSIGGKNNTFTMKIYHKNNEIKYSLINGVKYEFIQLTDFIKIFKNIIQDAILNKDSENIINFTSDIFKSGSHNSQI